MFKEIHCCIVPCLNNLEDHCQCKLDDITPNDILCLKLTTVTVKKGE